MRPRHLVPRPQVVPVQEGGHQLPRGQEEAGRHPDGEEDFGHGGVGQDLLLLRLQPVPGPGEGLPEASLGRVLGAVGAHRPQGASPEDQECRDRRVGGHEDEAEEEEGEVGTGHGPLQPRLQRGHERLDLGDAQLLGRRGRAVVRPDREQGRDDGAPHADEVEGAPGAEEGEGHVSDGTAQHDEVPHEGGLLRRRAREEAAAILRDLPPEEEQPRSGHEPPHRAPRERAALARSACA
mmetsp:Transcript_10769/g.31818  ORF Transcript_10769/g.31818 Transcript_10769/m.31818 type:complete len:237 (+) Transcript_10769:353-1063(+)